MCNKKSQFSSCSDLSSPVRIQVGDGRVLKGVGVGDVRLKVTLLNMQFLKQLEPCCLTQSSPKHSGLKLSQLLCMLKIGALLVLIKFDSFLGFE
ncbi:hypothetical protein FHG87_025001 [Trinorchestia longiramus]|nr:hypothetical protein FHG87_025001 [Trinorchestia longiramus]